MSNGARVFVSFPSEYGEAASRVVALLEAEGHSCWDMNRSARSEPEWVMEITRALNWCTDLVVLFGPEADDSRHVMREVAMADNREKSIHWLRLKRADPHKLEYFLCLPQGVDWFDQEEPPTEFLHALLADGQRRRHPAPSGGSGAWRGTARSGPADASEVVTLFVDRLSERDALRASLEAHLREASAENEKENNNLLTFYGIGGQGKSRLSRRLEHWLNGTLPTDDHWGEPPRIAHTVRWNFDQSHDRPQLLGFMVAFLGMLAETGIRFPEFELALAAFSVKVTGGFSGDDALQGIQSRILSSIDVLRREIGAPSMPAQLSSGWLRRLVSADRQRDEPRLQGHDGLDRLLELIDDRGDEPDAWDLIVAEAMDPVTRRLRAVARAERPTIAVFVDTFEAIQTPQRMTSEQVINALATHLPLCLFVVTGREQLNWHEPECQHIKWSGAQRWPSLARLDSGDGEPRQHELRYLSPEDTKDAIAHALSDVGWQVDEHTLVQLTDETQGWPLHVETLINLIHRKGKTGSTVLTLGELFGSFASLVQRLLKHLPDDVQLALQAAAVAESFDRDTLRMCDTAIKAGSVTRLLRTSLVSRSEDPFFPFKLHDELRRAVAGAGSKVPGGWEDEDRRDAAGRLVAGLEACWESARRASEHLRLMHVHSMAVRLCLKYKLDVEWVKEAFTKCPSHKYQRDLLPNVDQMEPDDEVLGLVLVYRALGIEDRVKRLSILESASSAATSDRVRFRADLWAMYAHRNLDSGSAVELAGQLLDDPYDRNCGSWTKPDELVTRQYAGTLSSSARWSELAEFDPDRRWPAWGDVELVHGLFAEAADRARRRLENHRVKRSSFRFEMELLDAAMNREVLSGRAASLGEFDTLASFASGLDIGWAKCRVISVVAPWVAIRNPGVERRLWTECSQLRSSLQTQAARRNWTLFALNVALATGDLTYADEAWQDYLKPGPRSNAAVPLAFFFRELGFDVEPEPLPWLEDVEVVRMRWLNAWPNMLIPPSGWEYSEELYG